ncbi:MAG: ABC transporter substrate-binding protein [Bacteroidota bacterium]|nr:ABC transporter substrate-binding protein [Bacteroidota bacterium]
MHTARVKLFWIAASLCVLPFFGFAVTTGDTIRLQLKWWHQFQFAGYYAADIKGFYKEQNLNVKILPGRAGMSPVEEVVNNRADFSICGSDLLYNFCNGAPVVALGALFQHSPYTIISLAKSNIRTPADLVRKRVMGSKDQGLVEIEAMLLKEGISPDSIHLLDHTWNNNDLITGKVDAFTGYIPTEPFQLTRAGVSVSYISPIDYGVDFYGDVLFTSNNLLKQNPVLVEQFREASFKGWEYALGHVEEMVNYILQLPGVKERGTTKTELENEAAQMQKLILPTLVEIGHMNEGRWQNILNTYQSLHLIPASKKLDKFLYIPAKAASQEVLKKLLYIIAAGSAVFLFILFYNLQLRKKVKQRTQQLQQEIDKHILTQQLLQKSEREFKRMAELLPLPLRVEDNEGKLIFINKAFTDTFGYTHDEIKDLSTWLLKAHLNKENLDIARKVRKEGYLANHAVSPLPINCKDGSIKIIEFNISREDGKVYIIYNDITEKRKAEEELKTSHRQLRELAMHLEEVREEERVKIARDIHDELGQLLVAIKFDLSFLQNMINQPSEALTDKMKALITLADASLVSVRKIATELRPYILDKYEFTEALQALNKDFTKRWKIDCHLTVPEQPLQLNDNLTVNLFRVYQEALNNVAKHAAATAVQAVITVDAYSISLTVSDNGKGMDTNEQSTRKSWGLVGMRERILRLNGTMRIDSVPGKGTTLRIVLPLEEGA